MGEVTNIEWTDRSWSPWQGCTKVSPACDHCYAETMAARFGKADLWLGQRRLTAESGWMKLPKWNAEAERDGRIFTVFPSICDPFDNQVPTEWRTRFWRAIQMFPLLRWLLLTKRPQNIKKMLPVDWGLGYPNVALGATVENQQEVDRRLKHLVDIPAELHFVSAEPLLSNIDLSVWLGVENIRLLTGAHWTERTGVVSAISWVIVGGETGRNARFMDPKWARDLRDQCAAAGVPFFLKQMTNKAQIPNDLFVREFPEDLK